MTHTASTRAFPLLSSAAVAVAIGVAAVTFAGPARAVPDAGTASTVLAVGGATSGCASAAADIARLRANLDRLYGDDYRVTIGCDPTLGITVQRGSFAGRVTENG
jgi:hypothetical protein